MSWFNKKVEEVKEHINPKRTEVYELTESWSNQEARTVYDLRKGILYGDSPYVNRFANVYCSDLEGWQFIASGNWEWAKRISAHYNIEVGKSKYRLPKELL